jgi:hypothetical protein
MSGTISEVFTDGFGRIALRNGVIRIELVSFTTDGAEVRQHVIMTLPAFLKSVRIQQAIAAKFEVAEVRRADPREPPPVVPAEPPEPEPDTATATPSCLSNAPSSPNFAEE